jgi:hypothetical protein
MALDQLGIRTIIIRTSNTEIMLHNVLHVPDADERFFLINVLLLKQGHIQLKDRGFTIYLHDKPVARGYLKYNLFWMDTEVLPQLNAHCVLNPTIDLAIWHQRMGHMSHNALKQYKDSVKGISFDATDHDQSPCPRCELSKHM